MEEDIIEACVLNAWRQGCDRVFLIDNDSPDATVERAEGVGAELLERFSTELYDEGVRLQKMNAWAESISVASGSSHVWWLFLDADELPTGPHGLPLRRYLERLGQRFRIVGSTTYNHYPTGRIANVPGTHPADHQPLAERYVLPCCVSDHYKHPLTRFDVNGTPPLIRPGKGFHHPEQPHGLLFEPVPAVVTHHFPFRNEMATRRRLHDVNRRAGSGEPSIEREAAIDAVYSGDWDQARVESRGVVYER